MPGHELTSMGGDENAFKSTHWTQIFRYAQKDEAARRKMLDGMIGTYWRPVYCYLRRRRYDNEQAKDLTQAFFQDIFLGKDLVALADKSKGRFRALLLTALNNYVRSVHRKQASARRSPAGPILTLDGIDGHSLPEPAMNSSPEDAFTYSWAWEIIRKVLKEVESSCRGKGMDIQWGVFYDKVIQPALYGGETPAMPELCRKYGIADEIKASNMIVTVKRKYQLVFREYLLQHVSSEVDVEQELAEILEILSKKPAGAIEPLRME
ncbi:MAG: sigma-70 family RNA polymerase sigma factor [Planctomycetes bacterium]|nr:sigma-70 family RNA polymerase sigma factor [Planctomycetota bacterium]